MTCKQQVNEAASQSFQFKDHSLVRGAHEIKKKYLKENGKRISKAKIVKKKKKKKEKRKAEKIGNSTRLRSFDVLFFVLIDDDDIQTV